VGRDDVFLDIVIQNAECTVVPLIAMDALTVLAHATHYVAICAADRIGCNFPSAT
jgi:hypothetical protein